MKKRSLSRGRRGAVLALLGVVSLASVLAYPLSIRPLLRGAVGLVPVPGPVTTPEAPPKTPTPKAARKKRTLAPICDLTVGPGVLDEFRTIQEAVNFLPSIGPCFITVAPGTYRESVTIESKNILATSEAQRIVIRSAIPGAAIVDPSTLAGTRAPGTCASGLQSAHGFTICSSGGLPSAFVTIKGFTIKDATVDGVNIFSASNFNIAGRDLTIDGNDIQNNGQVGGNGNGITIGINNPRLLIVNNLIRNNTRHGVFWPTVPDVVRPRPTSSTTRSSRTAGAA